MQPTEIVSELLNKTVKTGFDLDSLAVKEHFEAYAAAKSELTEKMVHLFSIAEAYEEVLVEREEPVFAGPHGVGAIMYTQRDALSLTIELPEKMQLLPNSKISHEIYIAITNLVSKPLNGEEPMITPVASCDILHWFLLEVYDDNLKEYVIDEDHDLNDSLHLERLDYQHPVIKRDDIDVVIEDEKDIETVDVEKLVSLYDNAVEQADVRRDHVSGVDRIRSMIATVDEIRTYLTSKTQ
jgi:hypothetical protein